MVDTCPRCGQLLPKEELMFCPACGWHLADQDYQKSQRPAVTVAGDGFYGAGWGKRDPKTRLLTPEIDTYYCWKCGTYKPLNQLSDEKICPDCGTPLRRVERHRPRLLYVVFAVTVLILSLLYIIFFRNQYFS